MNKYVMWPIVMGWHYWKIVSWRPAFEYLGDTKKMIWGFFSPLILSFVILQVFNAAPGGSMAAVVLGICKGFACIAALSLLVERSTTTSAITAVTAGVVTLANMLELGCLLNQVKLETWMWWTIVTLWCGNALVCFREQPEYIRAAGYKYEG